MNIEQERSECVNKITFFLLVLVMRKATKVLKFQ